MSSFFIFHIKCQGTETESLGLDLDGGAGLFYNIHVVNMSITLSVDGSSRVARRAHLLPNGEQVAATNPRGSQAELDSECVGTLLVAAAHLIPRHGVFEQLVPRRHLVMG